MIRLPYNLRRPEGVDSGIPIIRVLHYKLDCLLENIYIRLERFPTCGLNSGRERDKRIVVSLTSYPARIDKTYYAIKSLMLQTEKPDVIELWLAEDQFPNKVIPQKLENLVVKGLTIRWCDDLRSHKKYFYALQEQKPNEVVITYDDDIIYEKDSIEKLYSKSIEYPNCIICNRAHEMLVDSQGRLEEYRKWKVHSKLGVNSPSELLMPSTGNGCLYPYGCLPQITFDWNVAKANALTADDIWMRFCSLKSGVKVLRTKETIATLCNVYGSQRERLTQLNDIDGENQRVINRLLQCFPDLFPER